MSSLCLQVEKRKTHLKKMPLPDWYVGKPGGHFLNYWLVGENTAITDKVVLDAVRKQAKHVMRNKPISNTPI